MNEEYIKGIESISIARALIFFPGTYISYSLRGSSITAVMQLGLNSEIFNTIL